MSLNKLTIISIVLFAFALRIVNINNSPPALNWDEVSHGYNAFSILQTGRDEWGSFMPTIFRAYGDYKLPVYVYLTAISEFFLGLNAIGVRLPSILGGTGSVLLTYLLFRALFKSTRGALLAAFLVAVEPWSFFLSRAALEANVAMFLILTGIYLFQRGLVIARNKVLFVFSGIFLGLSVWTYNSARIFVPTLLLAIILIYRKRIPLAFYIVSALFIIPMIAQLLSSTGQARFENVQIIDEGAVAYLENKRTSSDLPPLINKFIYNRPIYFASRFAENYIKHFSPHFLFVEGGSHYQFNIPGYGLLHIANLPFFYFGIYLLLKNFKKKEYQLLLAWLILAPVASSLTREAPHTLRNIVFLPVPMIITSLAAVKILNRKLLIGYSVLLILLLGIYLQKYSNYRVNYSSAWQYGYQDTVSFIKANYANYDSIVLTKKYGEPHEFILFYWPWSPTNYQESSGVIRFYQSNWYWIDKFDKFYFVNDWEVPSQGEKFVTESGEEVDCQNIRCLLVSSPGNAPDGWHQVKVVDFLNGERAFEIYENK